MILLSLGIGYRRTGIHPPAGGSVNECEFEGRKLLIIAKVFSSNQQRGFHY